jgi:hypothetical protein
LSAGVGPQSPPLSISNALHSFIAHDSGGQASGLFAYQRDNVVTYQGDVFAFGVSAACILNRDNGERGRLLKYDYIGWKPSDFAGGIYRGSGVEGHRSSGRASTHIQTLICETNTRADRVYFRFRWRYGWLRKHDLVNARELSRTKRHTQKHKQCRVLNHRRVGSASVGTTYARSGPTILHVLVTNYFPAFSVVAGSKMLRSSETGFQGVFEVCDSLALRVDGH